MNKEIIITNARLSFPELETPKSVSGGKPRYGAVLLLDKEKDKKTIDKIEAVLKEIAKEEFAGKLPQGNDTCLRDGDDKEYDGYAGTRTLHASRAEKRGKPVVIDGSKSPVSPGDSHYPFAGCYVNAKVSIFSLNGKNDKGGDKTHGKKLCCELQVLQWAKKGEPFGSGTPTTDDMPEVEDDEDLGEL